MAAVKKPAKKAKAGNSKQSAAARKAIFVEAYIANGGNATQAAIEAGYAESDARNRGLRLMKEADISRQIAERTKLIANKYELTTERTLREVARLAYSDPRRFYNADGSLKPIHELDDDTAATIASVEVDELRDGGAVVGNTVKVKQWDKNTALEKAMKFHGLYERDNEQKPATVVLLEQIAANPASRIKLKP